MLSARKFGRDTDLWVFPVGLGAGQLESAPDVDRLLGTAIDLGVNVIDSARSYGASEELLGRHLFGRRDRVILSTKIGYGIAGVPDWTAPCITAGVDEALARLRTDRIDVVHLHSCPREVLERGEVVEALLAARRAGKVRLCAYSGDGAALEYAIDCGAFDAIQCSLGI